MTEREKLLEELLSEGLDLCVRARKLDDMMDKALEASMSTGTRCATPALWIQDQYDNDLAAWEKKSREFLLPKWMAKGDGR